MPSLGSCNEVALPRRLFRGLGFCVRPKQLLHCAYSAVCRSACFPRECTFQKVGCPTHTSVPESTHAQHIMMFIVSLPSVSRADDSRLLKKVKERGSAMYNVGIANWLQACAQLKLAHHHVTHQEKTFYKSSTSRFYRSFSFAASFSCKDALRMTAASNQR